MTHCLLVFEDLVSVVGAGIGVAVVGLLIEQLGFEEVGHLDGAGAVIVASAAEILFGLFDAALCDVELLTSLDDVVPGILHPYLEQFGLVLLFLARRPAAEIKGMWQADLDRFRTQRQPYLLYPE